MRKVIIQAMWVCLQRTHFLTRSVSDFIKTKEAEHIRGTECDQRILSKKESNGTVYSPNYPFPYHPNIVCRYFIYGLQDAQNLERVRLQFYDVFEIPAKPKIDKK